ncbi:DUF1684 domain-containing protein [Microbacterium resistens]|uniref:DUF1684 domain-containing protein n=1 Tax=Microbacterium resistens TaxID=156977 RepID=UPI0008335B72|nr:DUF1684 domain-containing protein [Microbacterium resistens]
MTNADPAAAAHDGWRARRRAAVTAPTGNLSLIETRWFPTDTTPEQAEALVAAERAASPAGVTVTALSRTGIDTGAPEHGLRVWDADSPAIRAFEDIVAFPYDPDWVIDARFAPVSADRTIPFEHIRDAGGSRNLVVPGDIVFERDGETFTLAAFDDGGTLLLVFGDPTNGRDDETGTYGSGRFLFVERDDAGGFGDAGTVRLDFNRAFVPPCGFSAQYNCPMPPPQNRFPWPVPAGERLVRFRDGFDIYTA